MKNLLLLLLCSQFALLAMEPQSAATAKKRPAAAGPELEEIEALKEAEPEKPAAKQARAEKKVYTLKIPVSGTSITIDEQIDVHESIDPIAFASLAELIVQGTKLSQLQLLARVPTSSGGTNFVEYYIAPNLHRFLFGNENGPQNPNTVARYTLKTPNKAPIAGEIYYYLYVPDLDSFEYVGSDREYFTDKQAIGKRIYDKTLELVNKVQPQTLVTLFLGAASFDYDLAKVMRISILEGDIAGGKKSLSSTAQRLSHRSINQFIATIKDKPASFLLNIYKADISLQDKLNAATRLLETIIKSDFSSDLSNEQRAILQQKLSELQKLKQE